MNTWMLNVSNINNIVMPIVKNRYAEKSCPIKHPKTGNILISYPKNCLMLGGETS